MSSVEGARLRSDRMETHFSGVGRNAAILTGVTLLCKAGSLAVMPFVLRAFEPAQWGLYSTAFAYAGMLGMITYFGMGPIVVRDIARGDSTKGTAVFHCVVLRLALLVVAAGALLALGVYKSFAPEMWVLSWLAFAVVAFDSITGAVKSSMQAEERFGLLASVDVVRKAAQWGLAIAVLVAGASVVHLAGGVVIAAAAALAVALLMGLSRRDIAGVTFAPEYARNMLRLAAPMGISAAFVLALERVDIWILAAFRGPSDVGTYAAGVIFKPVFLAQALVWAMLPLAFRLGKESRGDLAGAVRLAGRYLLIMGAAVALLFFCGAGTLMPILGGGKYEASVPVFELVGLSLPFAFMSFLFLHALTAVDKQHVAAAIFAGGLALNIIIDVLLVPSMGPVGAMLGTLTAEVAMTIAAAWMVWRLVGRLAFGKEYRILAAVLTAFAVAAATRAAGLADLGILALATLAGLLVALKAVSARDLSLVVRSMGRRE